MQYNDMYKFVGILDNIDARGFFACRIYGKFVIT